MPEKREMSPKRAETECPYQEGRGSEEGHDPALLEQVEVGLWLVHFERGGGMGTEEVERERKKGGVSGSCYMDRARLFLCFLVACFFA